MADIGKAPEGFPRRMQAARALAGLTIDQLAEELQDEPGLAARSLRDIETGKDVQRSRQRAIIEACGIPSVFVDADLMLLEAVYDGLSEIPADQRAGLGDDVLVTRALRLYADHLAEGDGTLEKRLAAVERAIDKLVTSAPEQQPAPPKTAAPSRDLRELAREPEDPSRTRKAP